MARLMSDNERDAARAVARLAYENPFLAARVESEQAALGEAFQAVRAIWDPYADLEHVNPNLPKLTALVEELAPALRDRLAAGARASRDELRDYQGLVWYLLYYRYEGEFRELIERGERGESTTVRVASYARYTRDYDRFLGVAGAALADPPHLFAWGYQMRRAFEFTFRRIYGGSMPAARLRAAVWQSIFTHDQRRYGRALYGRMGDVTTLVLGESGTGKELVARAVGLSRYLPFDPEARRFAHDYATSFHAVSIAALSPTLIESELFGHRRGAFTGALDDRAGWLETCEPHGTVFLDEIGDLDAQAQVKLLRVLQTRSFQRVGETRERDFAGKIIAATNRDLAAEIGAGTFRRDLYYRLCADVIRTPTLREQLDDDPGELRRMIGILSRRIVGDDEAESLADEASEWVTRHLGDGYAWPGNVRELEQCVRNVLIRGEYRPTEPPPARDGDLGAAVRAGELTADELLRRYCTQVYAASGSYEEAARRLGLDRRTVKARVDPELLERLTGGGGGE